MKRWFGDQRAFLLEHWGKRPTKSIGEDLGVSYDAVKGAAYRLRLGPGFSEPVWTDEPRAFLRENWGKMTAEEIGRHLGRTKNAIIGAAHRFGLGPGFKRPHADTPCARRRHERHLASKVGQKLRARSPTETLQSSEGVA